MDSTKKPLHFSVLRLFVLSVTAIIGIEMQRLKSWRKPYPAHFGGQGIQNDHFFSFSSIASTSRPAISLLPSPMARAVPTATAPSINPNAMLIMS